MEIHTRSFPSKGQNGCHQILLAGTLPVAGASVVLQGRRDCFAARLCAAATRFTAVATGMAAATNVFMEDESNVVIISMFPYLLVVVIFGKKA